MRPNETTGAFVAVFDKETGQVNWKTDRRESVGWGTPIVVRAGGRDELIVSSQRRVTAYDPTTGRELWTVAGNLFEVIPTPVVGQGLVVCSSGRAGPTLAIRPGGSGDFSAMQYTFGNLANRSRSPPAPVRHRTRRRAC